MTRADFLKYDITAERALFRAMTPNQRYEIWDGKLKDLLLLDWEPEEKDHLLKLLNYFEKNKFIFNIPKDGDVDDDFVLFMYKWTEYARETLNWDNQVLYAIAGNPKIPTIVANSKPRRLSLPEEYIDMSSKSRKTRTESSQQKDCDCRSSDDMDWCANRDNDYVMYRNCAGPCNDTGSDIGCGWALLQKCNGVCEEILKD